MATPLRGQRAIVDKREKRVRTERKISRLDMASYVCKKSETSKGENSKKSRGKEEILPLYRE